MGIRLDILNGTNWEEEKLTPTDLNSTLISIVNFAGIGVAQNAYQTLQANNVFDNKDYLAADEFVDSNGTNNTVNLTLTTGSYDADNDYYKIPTGSFSAKVVCDTNILPLSGNEGSMSVYANVSLPTGNVPDGVNDTTTTELTESSNSTVTDKRGLTITTNEDLFIQSVTKESTSTATKAYILNGSWNVADAVYNSVNFGIVGQDGSPRSIFFRSNGKKAYMLGANNDSVFQYSLGTAWDLNSASYDSVSKSVTTEDTEPDGMYIKPDGTKMYIAGNTNDSIFQYSLGTAWDLNSASYDSVSKDVSGQDGAITEVEFKPDGTKMYVLGDTNDSIFQYSLGTAWDLNSASYDSVSLDVSTEEDTPLGMSFKPDGTKVYVVGATNNRVDQYSLSTAWDLSTATNDGVSFGLESDSPGGIYFKPDGTRFYVCSSGADNIYQYDLTQETLTSGTFSGDVASMDSNIKLSPYIYYHLVLDNSGSNYTEVTDSTVTFPITGTYIDVEYGVVAGSTIVEGEYYNIVSIVSQSSTTGQATSITMDISDGSSTIVGTAIDQAINIKSLSSGNAKIIYNLATTDSSVTPTISGYGVYLK